ncbi:uncharacterized protein TRIVIDRAFT_50971 [Trichoderma virens Gv29-8]|uniref:Uncharacterized protein n=1 Tax=Hypocrea virens (strain Gv29-8 / FGSC 10586) TaxID=413071 RepID=G9N4M4_HYPVG|nr:uncharacterized protein TRIVIDRAFT_50971 [Trichoderma virens Gv29-8]EHK18548.1 hypothetical protein TRIVIDRAFT_50971 [Trichoderma virens Gv29-8]
MDDMTTPRWGSEYNPVTNSWADKLVAQRPATLLRAWCRIPVAAGPSTLRKGMTIMKRVGRSAKSRAVRPQTVAASQVAEETEETQQASRRRLGSFVPAAEDAVLELGGEPLSRAEIASAIMRAKVDVANCYLHEEYTDVSDQRKLAKQSQYTKKTVPMKRRFNDHSSIDFEYASGGNGAAIYRELDPIISRAMQAGVTEIDVNMASITEAGAHLRSTRRNPRVSLAASGMPELSDIADDSEPSSVLTLEPNESMSDAKSPTKRDSTQSPSPTKSNKSFRKRLSDTIVRLLPGSSPRAEPSPTKPSSPPTPSKEFVSPSKRTPSISMPKSPSASKSPLLSANSTPGLIRWSNKSSTESPFARWRPKRKSEPARLSTTPSPPRNDSSTLDFTMDQSFIVPESPVYHSRPKAPTPSKWSGLLPSTPSQKPSPTAATPVNDGASLDLVKSLPEWMQHNLSPTTLEKCDPSKIHFRPASPSFTNSVSWVNSPTDVIENERTKIVRRRKSEPLSRNMLKSQTLRRISLSPHKLIRSGDMSGAMPTIDEPAPNHEDAISQLPQHTQASELFNSSATQPNTPNNAVTEQTAGMETDFSQLSWNYKADIEDILRQKRNAPPPVRHPDDVFDDPDDRYRLPSPPPHNPVKRLARMAETGCFDKASVMVGRKEGRLLVQFKLPIKYKHLFPKNQEIEEPSQSTASPSEPQSPILQFFREFPEDTPEPPKYQPADKTLVVSDFGGSPAKQSSLPAENEASHLVDETLVVSDFGSPAKHSLSAGHEEAYNTPYVSPEPLVNVEPPMNSDSSSPLSDLENTPPLNPSSELSIAIMATQNQAEQSTSTHGEPSPADSTTDIAPASTSPISFTPVNQASAQKKSAPNSTRSPELGKQYPISHDDTPERDFLRDFIRRSKPRRHSTTETGSPIAPPPRQPLGARSPNMETQPKEKRKFESSEGEENENENENETKPEPAAKRVRRMPRATPSKSKPVATNYHSDEEPLANDATATSAKSSDGADELANTKEQKEASVAAVSRRSSRLKAKPSAIPKPSIPAPTKIGRGRPPTNSTLGSVRNEQQDLVHQTRANTRRNKGNAEYPAQVLARQSSDEEGDGSQQDEAEAKARRGKSVVWKEPLASYQEEEKPKRGRPAAKAKPVGNRVSKPAAKPSAAAQKQRSTRIAAGLGMVENGTPAPKRATRASTRTRK